MLLAVLLISGVITCAVIFATYWPQSNYSNGMMFAVSLPAEAGNHRDTERVRTEYRKRLLQLGIGSAVLLVPLFFLSETYQVIYFLLWTFAAIVALVFPFRRAHSEMLALKRKHHWSVPNQKEDEDRYWGNGFTYHNPNDRRVFVEKRIGVGMTVNTGTPVGKWFIGATIGITAAILIGVSFMLIRAEYTMPTLQMTEEQKVSIEYPMYSFSFDAGEIEEITLIDELPRGVRINGEATEKYARGHFRLNDIGRARLYIVKNNPPYIHIRLKDGNIFYNEADSQATRQLYDELVRFAAQ